MGHVKVRFYLVVLEVLIFDFIVQAIDLIIKFCLLLRQLLESFHKLLDLFFVVLLVGLSHPLYRILLGFFNIPNALENICNVIDSSLLDLQLVDCEIEIQGEVARLFDQLHEFFC